MNQHLQVVSDNRIPTPPLVYPLVVRRTLDEPDTPIEDTEDRHKSTDPTKPLTAHYSLSGAKTHSTSESR